MLKLRAFTFGYRNLRKLSSFYDDKMRSKYLFIVQIIHILAFKILVHNYGIVCDLIAAYPSLLASAATAASPFLPTASFHTVFSVATSLRNTLYACQVPRHPSSPNLLFPAPSQYRTKGFHPIMKLQKADKLDTRKYLPIAKKTWQYNSLPNKTEKSLLLDTSQKTWQGHLAGTSYLQWIMFSENGCSA